MGRPLLRRRTLSLTACAPIGAPANAKRALSVSVVEVKSIWPLSTGLHTCHKGRYNGLRRRRPKRIPKTGLSSDRALQLARVKLKPLVIVHQNVTVNLNQALHTPPITLGECAWQDRGMAWVRLRYPWDCYVGDLGEVDTR